MTKFQKYIITLYRHLAILVLGGVLSTALGYVIVTLFYTVNSSWAAPLVISPTHEKILRLSAEVFRAQQSADTLEAEVSTLIASTALQKTQYAALEPLVESSARAVSSQAKIDKSVAASLSGLLSSKDQVIQDSGQFLKSLAGLRGDIERELNAGLITKQDAARAQLTLLSTKTAAVDSQVGRVALARQIQDLNNSAHTLSSGKGGLSLAALELETKLVTGRRQLDDLALQISQNQTNVETKAHEVQKLRRLIRTLSDSPYYRASQISAQSSFAFIPYENSVKEGDDIYDCTLHMVWCKKVGTVTRVYFDEERVSHPLFRVDVRGTLVELTLTDSDAAKSRVVFVGRPPLLF